MYIKSAIGFLLLICSNCYAVYPHQQSIRPINGTTKTLKLLHALFRHGQRTPLQLYPKDPYINETFYPYGIGQLTNEGKQLLFSIGKWLSKRYENYIDQQYAPDVVWAQATDYPRTIMSTLSLLAGLFPPNHKNFEWNKRINWQPIPIIAEPLNEDSLLLIRQPCPRHSEALNEVFEMPEVKSFMAENNQLFKQLTNLTGFLIRKPTDIQLIYGTLRSEREYGLKLPKWTKEYYPHRLIQLNEMSFVYNSYTEELKRLTSGPFLQKMINEWLQKRNGTITPKNRKIYLYGGHDTTVVNLFQALNIWNREIPDYGITAMFELLQDNSSGIYGVQIYKRTSPETIATPLAIPGCNHFCPLDKFIELTKNVVPVNIKEECLTKSTTKTH